MTPFSDEEKDSMGLNRREADRNFEALVETLDQAIFQLELSQIIYNATKPTK